ncbi:response regulator, partial [Thermodesulfobacteriota bacterium]
NGTSLRILREMCVRLGVDSRRAITAVGYSFSLITGFTEEEIIGKSFDDLAVRIVEAQDELLHCCPTAPVFGKECTMEAKDGRTLNLLANCAPVRSAHGEVVGGIVSLADVTELIEAREAAQAADQAKSEFLARMSHEVRTPMNAILGFTDLVLEEDMPPAQRGVLDAIKRSGQTLLTLLNDILDLSKIEADKMVLSRKPLNLESIVYDVSEMAGILAADRKLEILCHVDELPSNLEGDPTRIQQILANLLSNSVKFTKEGEVVTEVRLLRETEERANVSIGVRDTGIGISEDKLDSVFDVFTQADGSASRRYGGTGLGLAICRRLVTMMGGEIRVDSRKGEGSTFEVNLWLNKTSSEKVEDYRPSADQFPGACVLIVDDNGTSLRILREMCVRLGVEPVCVPTTTEALAYVLERAFDLILVDSTMPDMDCYQFASEIRQRRPEAPSFLVAMASRTREQRDLLRRASPFLGVLLKPVRRTALIEMLRKAGGLAHQAPDFGPGRFPAAPAGPKLQVLLAEDDLLSQKMALWMLRKLGHETDLAENGSEAIEMGKVRDYDLILMDMHMPVVDGIQAAKTLRQAGIAVPIVAVTAAAMMEDRQRCLEAGMNDYVSKPMDRETLMEIIKKHCLGKEGAG